MLKQQNYSEDEISNLINGGKILDESKPQAYTYAGFGLRLIAEIIDLFILIIIYIIFNYSSTCFESSINELLVAIIIFGIQVLIALLYETIMISKYGATIGKMTMKIKVTDYSGNLLPYSKSFGRFISKDIIFSFTLCIGFLWILWDKKKQGLHDKMAGTLEIGRAHV